MRSASTIALPGGTFSVIGVAPATFFGETVGDRPDAWLPLVMQATVLPGRDWLRDNPAKAEKVMWLHGFARLRPGVTLETAQANANVVFQQGLAAYYGGSGLSDGGSQALPESAAAPASGRDRRVAASQQLRRTALRAARRRRARPPDRLRQRRQSAAGADDGAQSRDVGAAGAGRVARTAGSSAADRKPVPLGARRPRGTRGGLPDARGPAAARRGSDRAARHARRARARLPLRRDAARRPDARPAARAADDEDARLGGFEGTGPRPRPVRRPGSASASSWSSDSSRCRCRCWWARACCCGR